jgi:hypothetical protein
VLFPHLANPAALQLLGQRTSLCTTSAGTESLAEGRAIALLAVDTAHLIASVENDVERLVVRDAVCFNLFVIPDKPFGLIIIGVKSERNMNFTIQVFLTSSVQPSTILTENFPTRGINPKWGVGHVLHGRPHIRRNHDVGTPRYLRLEETFEGWRRAERPELIGIHFIFAPNRVPCLCQLSLNHFQILVRFVEPPLMYKGVSEIHVNPETEVRNELLLVTPPVKVTSQP